MNTKPIELDFKGRLESPHAEDRKKFSFEILTPETRLEKAALATIILLSAGFSPEMLSGCIARMTVAHDGRWSTDCDRIDGILNLNSRDIRVMHENDEITVESLNNGSVEMKDVWE